MQGGSFRSAITRAPMLRLVLPFVAGLAFARYLDAGPLWAGVAALLAAAGWYLLSGWVKGYAHRWLHGALLILALFLFGVFWQVMRSPVRASAELAKQRGAIGTWAVQVEELVSVGERSARMRARVNTAVDGAHATAIGGHVLLTVMLDSTLRIPAVGDELVVHARVDTIERVPDPGGFDQRAWAASYGVYHQAFAPPGRWSLVRQARGYASFFEGARRRIVRWLERSDLDPRERGMVKAILLGIRDELDQDQKTAFARSGTMHVLAVSGSHVALIYGALLWAFRPLGERRRWTILRSIVILLVLWIYAGITGATPSVLRATATFTLFCIADLSGRKSDPVNSLAAAAFLLLVLDPVMLGQLSFQLSFLAVVGIALCYRPLMHLWAPPNLVLHYLWSLFSVSIAAQLMTTPLALLSFHAFPVWFLPANMVIVGLVACAVYGGSALLVLQWIPFLREAATGFMVFLLECIGRASDFFAWLPGAYPAVRIGVWQCVWLYVLGLLLVAWILERWNWARIGTCAAALALLLSWGWNARERNSTRRFVVYDERDHLSCAVEQGRALTVFTDTLDGWSRRKIARHQRACGAVLVDTVLRIPADLAFGDSHIRLLSGGDEGMDTLTTSPIDVVVLTDDAAYDPARIHRLFAPRDGIVLASTMRPGRRARIREWGAEQGVRIHDVRVHGAYVR